MTDAPLPSQPIDVEAEIRKYEQEVLEPQMRAARAELAAAQAAETVAKAAVETATEEHAIGKLSRSGWQTTKVAYAKATDRTGLAEVRVRRLERDAVVAREEFKRDLHRTQREQEAVVAANAREVAERFVAEAEEAIAWLDGLIVEIEPLGRGWPRIAGTTAGRISVVRQNVQQVVDAVIADLNPAPRLTEADLRAEEGRRIEQADAAARRLGYADARDAMRRAGHNV